MTTRPTQLEFMGDVQSHTMKILRDDGAYRHLLFQQPENSWLHRFEVVTWPGALCIRGDVGTYVFSRLTDTFEFFRSPMTSGDRLYINDGYWAEKLIATDCRGRNSDGVMRFDPDEFCDAVNRRYVEHARYNMRGRPEDRRSLRQALEDDVLAYANESEAKAMRAAGEFEHDGFRLDDFWEVNCRRYTAQFIWALYAISWAIREYDRQKSPQESQAA